MRESPPRDVSHHTIPNTNRMRQRLLPLAALGLVATLFSSCSANSTVQLLPKSSVGKESSTASWAGSKADSFPIASPSQTVLTSAKAKVKDKHGMPVYAFSERRRLVRTTAYHPNESDHLIYGSSNATGTPLRYTDRVRSAAADWSFYPVGTVFRISGLPYLYVVDDYGSALNGTGTIDIFTPNDATMKAWGRRNVEVTIVQWGSFTRSAEILAKRTKHNHCRAMLANIVRQRPDLASSRGASSNKG
jgi:3D (Asp-Asp-Asp) domain-containing protein